MRTSTRLATAALALAASTVSVHAQTVASSIFDNYDDGLGANRWNFIAREQGVDSTDPAKTVDASIIYNFDYSATTFESNHGTVGTTSTTPGQRRSVGAAPQGGGSFALQIHVNDTKPAVNAIVAAVVTPKGITVGSDYILKTDMFLNYNAPGAGSGSTESYMLGLTDGTGLAGDDFATGSIASNLSAPGYAFEGSSDGDNGGDYRVYARRVVGDDGPRYSKIDATWTGTSRQSFIQADGTYGGTLILPEEANGGADNGTTIPYRGFNNSNTYFRDELFPTDGYTNATNAVTNPNGYETAGVVGKHWVTAQVEQHGKIALYTINGKVINHLFTPAGAALAGTPEMGLTDQTSGEPDDTTDSYILYDNTTITTLNAATPNVIAAGSTYPVISAGGTVTSNGAATINGLTMDTASTTLAGTGTLQLGTTSVGNGDYGAIWAGQGAQVISKPLNIAADSAIYVDGAADSLTISNLTTNPNVDLTKAGLGKLTVNAAGLNVKSITVGRSGATSGQSSKLVLTGAGGAKTTYLWLESVPALTATLPLSTTLATLDFGHSVVAIDYSNAASVTPAPAVPLSPLPYVQLYLNNGYAADANGNPQWTGTGIVTSASEVQGAAFTTPSNPFTVRVAEASLLGYGASQSAWGSLGKTIDATTVLFGFTFKADTNVDQDVDFDDLLVLAKNYGQTVDNTAFTSWTKGDFNGSGTVDFDDLLILAASYGKTVGGSTSGVSAEAFAADWKLAQAIAPEPASLAAVLGLGSLALGRRRR